MKTFQDILMKDKSAEVRAALAESQKLPADIANALAEDKHKLVRESIAGRDDLSKDLIAKFLSDQDANILSKVLETQELSEAQFEPFVSSESLSVKRSVSANRFITKNIVNKLADDDHVLNYLVFNPSIGSDVRSILVGKILKSEFTFMQEELAEKLVGISSDIWDELIKANNEDVCRSLASNPLLTEKQIEFLAKHESESVRRRVAGRSSLQKKACKLLANDPSEYVLYDLAKNTDLQDPSVLIDLAQKSAFPYVVTNALRNPLLDLEKVPAILESKDEDVLCHIAINPSVPSKWIQTLLLKGDFVKPAIARNPSTALSVLKVLSCDSDSNVRTRAASNINLPASLLEVLATDSDETVRFLVACNKNTSADVLDKLSTDDDWQVRQAVAGNLNASDQSRLTLAKDKTKEVRIVLANPGRFDFPSFVDNP